MFLPLDATATEVSKELSQVLVQGDFFFTKNFHQKMLNPCGFTLGSTLIVCQLFSISHGPVKISV